MNQFFSPSAGPTREETKRIRAAAAAAAMELLIPESTAFAVAMDIGVANKDRLVATSLRAESYLHGTTPPKDTMYILPPVLPGEKIRVELEGKKRHVSREALHKVLRIVSACMTWTLCDEYIENNYAYRCVTFLYHDGFVEVADGTRRDRTAIRSAIVSDAYVAKYAKLAADAIVYSMLLQHERDDLALSARAVPLLIACLVEYVAAETVEFTLCLTPDDIIAIHTNGMVISR